MLFLPLNMAFHFQGGKIAVRPLLQLREVGRVLKGCVTDTTGASSELQFKGLSGGVNVVDLPGACVYIMDSVGEGGKCLFIMSTRVTALMCLKQQETCVYYAALAIESTARSNKY